MKAFTSEQHSPQTPIRATIEDVARRAGVSIATVSRALNEPDRVRQETRERVETAMHDLSYVPNVAGRGLANGKTNNIGIVLLAPQDTSSADVFFLENIRGIESAVAESSLAALVVVQPLGDADQPRVARLLADARVDGLIVAGGMLASRHLKAIRRFGLPLVLLGPHEDRPDVWSVMPDSREGSENAVLHLIRSGRRRIVHIGGPAEQGMAAMKLEGYRLAHGRAGLTIDPGLHVVAEELHSREGGQRAVEGLLEADLPFDAVYAADDLLALGALRALLASGRRVPDDVALVGYGDLEEARFATPPLTTVHVDLRQQGWLAGTILARALSGQVPSAVRVKLETHLIVRESSGTCVTS